MVINLIIENALVCNFDLNLVGCPILQEVPESWLFRARMRTFSKLFLDLASFF